MFYILFHTKYLKYGMYFIFMAPLNVGDPYIN